MINKRFKNLKGINNIYRYHVIKRLINDKDYYFNRMSKMAENMIYWKTFSKHHANLVTEREFCKQMEELYFKRFLYYKNKIG